MEVGLAEEERVDEGVGGVLAKAVVGEIQPGQKPTEAEMVSGVIVGALGKRKYGPPFPVLKSWMSLTTGAAESVFIAS